MMMFIQFPSSLDLSPKTMWMRVVTIENGRKNANAPVVPSVKKQKSRPKFTMWRITIVLSAWRTHVHSNRCYRFFSIADQTAELFNVLFANFARSGAVHFAKCGCVAGSDPHLAAGIHHSGAGETDV